MRESGRTKGPFRRVLRCAPEEYGRHRYLLEIALAPASRPRLAVVLKNPSTASAERSDPTAGKVEAWARRAGFGALAIVNLFALRSPRPGRLNEVPYGEAVGKENDRWILRAARGADRIILAWGDPNGVERERYERRIREVMRLLKGKETGVVGVTKKGYPRHGLGWNRGVTLSEAKGLCAENRDALE